MVPESIEWLAKAWKLQLYGRVQKALQQKRQRVYIIQNIVMCYVYKSLIIATPLPSIQSDPIPSEVSGSTDSTAIVSELIDLVAATCL